MPPVSTKTSVKVVIIQDLSGSMAVDRRAAQGSLSIKVLLAEMRRWEGSLKLEIVVQGILAASKPTLAFEGFQDVAIAEWPEVFAKGYSNLRSALDLAAKQFATTAEDEDSGALVLLITDGLDTSEGDWAQTFANLEACEARLEVLAMGQSIPSGISPLSGMRECRLTPVADDELAAAAGRVTDAYFRFLIDKKKK